MDEKAEVLHFATLSTSGGIEMFLRRITEYMDEDKVRFDFVTPYTRINCAFGDIFQSDRSNLYSLGYSDRRYTLKQRIKLYGSLKRFLVKHPYEIVHLHHNIFVSAVILARAAKAAGTKYVIAHSHIAFPHKSLKGHILGLILRLPFVSAATHYMACSDLAAKTMFPPRIVRKKEYMVLNVGVDIERLRYKPAIRKKLRDEIGLKNEFVIGHVGRFVEQKNHIFLLEIFEEILKRNADMRLLLVGEGELDEEIRRKAKELGVSDFVIFFGVTDKIHEVYQMMDVFVFPSLYEGIGTVAIEAQTAGLHTFCSDAIPQEANITKLFHQIPLSLGARFWADRILELMYDDDRADTSDQIRAAGFDAYQTARGIEDFYLSL